MYLTLKKIKLVEVTAPKANIDSAIVATTFLHCLNETTATTSDHVSDFS